MKNLQEQVKKAFCYQKLFWPFTVWINCSSDLKRFANSRHSALNFKKKSRSLEQFFLTVCQNNFGNKILFWIRKITLITGHSCILVCIPNLKFKYRMDFNVLIFFTLAIHVWKLQITYQGRVQTCKKILCHYYRFDGEKSMSFFYLKSTIFTL